MKYRVRKYRKKMVCPFETYEPKKRIELSREQAVPLLVRIGNRLVCLGGLISLFTSSFLILVKGIFGVEERVRKFSFRGKVVEIKVREGGR